VSILPFEDFTVGRVFPCGPYTVSKDEIFEFAREFDPQPHHLDEEAASKSMLKGLSASGWHVCAIAMRMIADDILNKAASRGGVGTPDARWIKPVRPGDPPPLLVEGAETPGPRRSPGVGFPTIHIPLVNAREQAAQPAMIPIIAKRGSA